MTFHALHAQQRDELAERRARRGDDRIVARLIEGGEVTLSDVLRGLLLARTDASRDQIERAMRGLPTRGDDAA